MRADLRATAWLIGLSVIALLLAGGIASAGGKNKRKPPAWVKIPSIPDKDQQKGAKGDGKAEAKGNTDPDYLLCVAADRGELGEVKPLVEGKGAHVSSAQNRECSPVAIAAVQGDVALIEYLLAKGAKIDERQGEEKWTAMHFAANWARPDIIKYLLSKGADVNVRDKDLNAPIHLAIDQYNPMNDDSLKTIEVLVNAKGFDRNARNGEGRTPSEWAIVKDCKDVARYIETKKWI